MLEEDQNSKRNSKVTRSDEDVSENEKRYKIIQRQCDHVMGDVLTLPAQVYLYIMAFSRNYLFESNLKTMKQIRNDNFMGKHNDGIDLIELIK